MLEIIYSLLSLRWRAVWLRNLKVWKKQAGPAVIANFGDPILYLFALGYGFGNFVSEVNGVPYILFLTTGLLCTSVMNSASFEGLFSAYTRMGVQETWGAMLITPLGLVDVVLGEMVWAASKGLLSAMAILIVAGISGILPDYYGLLALPVLFCIGLCFAAMALLITSFARNYDFFSYYITLVVTPMFLISGVFFPVANMHPWIQWLAQSLPLAHGVNLVRAIIVGPPYGISLLPIMILLFYTTISFYLALYYFKRRLMA